MGKDLNDKKTNIDKKTLQSNLKHYHVSQQQQKTIHL